METGSVFSSTEHSLAFCRFGDVNLIYLQISQQYSGQVQSLLEEKSVMADTFQPVFFFNQTSVLFNYIFCLTQCLLNKSSL